MFGVELAVIGNVLLHIAAVVVAVTWLVIKQINSEQEIMNECNN